MKAQMKEKEPQIRLEIEELEERIAPAQLNVPPGFAPQTGAGVAMPLPVGDPGGTAAAGGLTTAAASGPSGSNPALS